jgi:hypothetical protein
VTYRKAPGALPLEDRVEYLRSLLPDVTPGPWRWWGQNDSYSGPTLVTVGRGISTVMGFKRLGMRSAQPTWFRRTAEDRDLHGWLSGVMVTASDVAVQEVDYRKDIVDMDNPDARWIAAASPDVVEWMFNRITELEQEQEK